MGIPHIDPMVEYVGVSTLRRLTSTALRDLKTMLVVSGDGTPLVVILKYEQFLAIQELIAKAGR